jgi:hypothetical protein
VTSIEVTTTRFPEGAFNEGLVVVNLKAKESEEPDHTTCDPRVTYDVISEDTPIPFQFIRLESGNRGSVRPNGVPPERLNTGDNDTGKHKGFQGKGKTISHSTNHV